MADTTAKKTRTGSPLMNLEPKDLIEHAKKQGKEAVAFLVKLFNEEIELTEAQKNSKRKKMSEKTKEDGTPFYTEEQIQEELKKLRKRTVLEQRVAYAKEYWPEMAPKKDKKESEYEQMLLDAMAEFENDGKKKGK